MTARHNKWWHWFWDGNNTPKDLFRALGVLVATVLVGVMLRALSIIESSETVGVLAGLFFAVYLRGRALRRAGKSYRSARRPKQWWRWFWDGNNTALDLLGAFGILVGMTLVGTLLKALSILESTETASVLAGLFFAVYLRGRAQKRAGKLYRPD